MPTTTDSSGVVWTSTRGSTIKTAKTTDANGVVWNLYQNGNRGWREIDPTYKTDMYSKGYNITATGQIINRNPAPQPPSPASMTPASAPTPVQASTSQPSASTPSAPQAPVVDKAYNSMVSSAPKGRGSTRGGSAQDVLFGNMSSDLSSYTGSTDQWGSIVNQARRRRAGLAGFGDMLGSLFGG